MLNLLSRLRGLRPALTRRAFWLWAALITLLRCAVTHFQLAYMWAGGAPLDDELMFRAANAITSGQWLGEYDYLTLSKSMFFAVWLALLNKLHLPYLLGGALLWCAAALLAAFALRPLWRKSPAGQGRALTLLLYALLAFLPSSWASYTLRVYRDNIFPALCLLFFAGMAGAALRAVFYTRQQAPIWPWLLAAGVGLACGYLNREDAGLFLLPFAIAATLCMLVVLLHRRRWLCAAAQVIPYAVLAAGVGIFCALNQHWYGVWGLSDFSEGSFADAMGAMTRVATDSDEPLLSLPMRAKSCMPRSRSCNACNTGWRRTPSCKMISATRNWTITVRAAFIGQSAVPPSMRAFTPTLPPPMPIGRAQPMPSMLPVITAPCPPAAAGAAPPASPSVRSMYCPQSGKLPRAPSGP